MLNIHCSLIYCHQSYKVPNAHLYQQQEDLQEFSSILSIALLSGDVQLRFVV